MRTVKAYADQERPVADRVRLHRGLRMIPTGDGLVRVEGFLTELEAAEVEEALRRRIAEEDRADEGPAPAEEALVSEAPISAETWVDRWEAEQVAGQFRAARLADALVDLIRDGAQTGDRPGPSGADRYCTHVVVIEDGPPGLLDGTPISAGDAARVACDTQVVEHHYSLGGEPLYLGRRTRTWTTAQQRAARVRDGGRCRFPGCARRVVDLHHLQWWDRGGATDLDNGLLLCGHHHTLVHEGRFSIEGNPNHAVTFCGPHGAVIGVSAPVVRAVRSGRCPPAPVRDPVRSST